MAAGAAVAVVLAASALPAAADSLPDPNCNTTCTATFDTVGAAFTFNVPAGITALSATIAGAAGAPPSFAITNDPTAVGGAGGVTTIPLGASYAGATIIFGVGGAGEGSYLQGPGSVLLAVAGGGGQGGYAAYLDLPDQILGTYPGGDGGSPSAPGVTAGGDATAFGAHAANGLGGTAVGGIGGTGVSNGTDGGSTTLVAPAGATLAAGGAGGTILIDPLTHDGGVGGSGYTGGGGGAIERNIDNGDVPVDLVAPGGGGSGYLDAALTATAGTPNTGGGWVSFTWTYPPALAATGTEIGDGLPGIAVLLLITGAAIMTASRRRAGVPGTRPASS